MAFRSSELTAASFSHVGQSSERSEQAQTQFSPLQGHVVVSGMEAAWHGVYLLGTQPHVIGSGANHGSIELGGPHKVI